jgi:hypothetical protein
MAVSIKRLRSLATIALVNSLVIFITLFSDWTLQEATLAYLGELVVLVVLICLRVLLAKRLPGDEIGRFRWRLVGAKLLAIGISLPLYAFVVGVTLLMLHGDCRQRDIHFRTGCRERDSAPDTLALAKATRAHLIVVDADRSNAAKIKSVSLDSKSTSAP